MLFIGSAFIGSAECSLQHSAHGQREYCDLVLDGMPTEATQTMIPLESNECFTTDRF